MSARPAVTRSVLSAVAALILAACDTPAPTAPRDPGGARLGAAVVSNATQPLAWLFGNPCTGGPFFVTGTVHIVQTSTRDASGGFHSTITVNFQNASGEDQANGVKYRVISTQAASFNATGSGQVELTGQSTFKLVGQGPLNDYTFRVRSHLTINANGTVAVQFYEPEWSCG